MFLTDAEIADICAPLTQSAAQVKYLRALGLTVKTKPNGRALVVRSHAEAVLSGNATTQSPPAGGATESQPVRPNRAGLIALFGSKAEGASMQSNL